MYSIQLKEQYDLFINGKWVNASDGGTFETKCPANGEVLTRCAQATADDVDAAVMSAWDAFPEWKKVSKAERSAMLLRIADAIDSDAERLAQLESLDTGKTFSDALYVDIPGVSSQFRYYAALVQSEEGSSNMLDGNYFSVIMREPLGVVGAIVPWNFPLLMASYKIAPALAAGNCIVVKPSSMTSLSMLGFCELVQDILPPGVINVVTGSGSRSGEYLLQHPQIRKLSFTGSTEVGYRVAAAAADKLIPATLELGGKSANILFPDCDFDLAMEGFQLGTLSNQGQVCSAGSRVFVHKDIYDRFVEAAVKAYENIKVGMPWDPSSKLGSLISDEQLQKILRYVDIAREEGATVACGGVRATEGDLAKGAFMRPTLLTNVSNDMRVAREEIFGPVACVIKFRTEEEVIAMANDSDYGLCGGVFTKDINRALRVANAIEAGRIWVNTYNMFPSGASFGGYKKSGYGREVHKSTLEHYTQSKCIIVNMSEKPMGIF